jgi:glutamate carboxypeptidase
MKTGAPSALPHQHVDIMWKKQKISFMPKRTKMNRRKFVASTSALLAATQFPSLQAQEITAKADQLAVNGGERAVKTRARTGNAFSLVTARKGRAVYRISVEGRAAHAGSHHERGANAIVQLSETIQKVAALTDYSKQLTFNVATVTGGTVINRVPHFATAEGELRTFEREIYNCGIEKLLALSGKGSVCSAEDGHPSEVKIEVTQESPPWPRNNGTDRLFSIFSEVSSELGLRVVREERGGISDGNFICHVMPVLDGLGPNGDNGHCSEQSADGSKEQEYIDVTSIIPKAALNTLAILRLAQSA